jgi:hypothetical protein
VDKVEDEVVDSDKAPVDEATAPAEEPAAPEEAEHTETSEEAKETEAPEKVKETKKPVDLFADEKKADLTPLFIVAGMLGLAVILLVIAWADYWNYSTAVYIAGLTFIPLLLWLSRKTNTVYVVFLGCVIAVLMTCIYCLWTVVAKYNFDVKASEAKERVGMAQPVDRHVLAWNLRRNRYIEWRVSGFAESQRASLAVEGDLSLSAS